METAAAPSTNTRSRKLSSIIAKLNLSDGRIWMVALILLIGVAIVGFFARPTYPNYDSYYSLVWGKELFSGHLPTFDVYRAPTEHPLAVAFGGFLSLFGSSADRLMVLATLLSLVALAVAVFRVGQVLFSPLVGAVAAFFVLTRFDFPFLAIRGYVDIPYLALVFAAAALEVARPKRGVSVLLILAAAGLLRPEAWVLAGLYFLYISWSASWWQRFGYAALTAVAPVIWFGLDWIVTGDPLFSLNSTKELAGELERQRSLSEVPKMIPLFFRDLVKLPIALLGGLGFVIGLAWFRKKMIVPGALLLVGVFTFVALAAVGLSAISRYLMVPSIALCLLAALALVGFLAEPRLRYWKVWAGISAVAVLIGGIYTVGHRPDLTKFEDEIAFQGDIHRSFKETLADPTVKRAIERCGPLSVPTHKFVPDASFILGVSPNEILPRADRTSKYGVAVFVFGRKAAGRYGDSIGTNPLATSVPQPGYSPIASSRAKYTVAYSHCRPLGE